MALTRIRYGIISVMVWSSLAASQVRAPSGIAQLDKGRTSGQFYVNSELHLRYQLPDGWAVSEKETVASHQFSWADKPSAKDQQTPTIQCSKNLLFVTKHPEGMTLSGFDPMELIIAIDPTCFPEINFPKSTADHEAIQRAAGQFLSHLQTPGAVVRAPARVRAFENGGRLMLDISRPLSITTREITLGSRTMIRNVDRSVLMLPARGYWIAWIFVSGDDVDMDYLKATKIFLDEPGDSSSVK